MKNATKKRASGYHSGSTLQYKKKPKETKTPRLLQAGGFNQDLISALIAASGKEVDR